MIEFRNMNNDLKVYVGYDPREDIAWQVCRHSILKRNPNVKIEPLIQSKLKEKGWYWRPEDKLGSTEFTFTRFLVPALCNYEGWALFCDCDIIFLDDIRYLFDYANDKYAVMCVHHDYTPKPGQKMDGQQQFIYPRKNWSSVILWNCGHPSNQKISVDLINDSSTTGKYLHRFSWLDDGEIGEISHEWNWLSGWYKEDSHTKPKALHYTEGGPWFDNYRFCEYHGLWKKELFSMMEGTK